MKYISFSLYTYDIRKWKTPVNVHMDHVEAVIDVDYSPTGKEFVSGSYDKSIRIFEVNKGHSREVYHTKRMQRLTCVGWSLDNKYIISGSDEMNLRLWKAKASEKLGVVSNTILKFIDLNVIQNEILITTCLSHCILCCICWRYIEISGLNCKLI